MLVSVIFFLHLRIGMAGVNMSCCPRSVVVFVVQLITVLGVIICALINLSLSAENHDLWLVLLSGAIGIIFPSPALKKRKIPVLGDSNE